MLIQTDKGLKMAYFCPFSEHRFPIIPRVFQAPLWICDSHTMPEHPTERIASNMFHFLRYWASCDPHFTIFYYKKIGFCQTLEQRFPIIVSDRHDDAVVCKLGKNWKILAENFEFLSQICDLHTEMLDLTPNICIENAMRGVYHWYIVQIWNFEFLVKFVICTLRCWIWYLTHIGNAMRGVYHCYILQIWPKNSNFPPFF